MPLKKNLFDFSEEINGEKIINLNKEEVANYVNEINSDFYNLPVEEMLSFFFHTAELEVESEEFDRTHKEGWNCQTCGKDGHAAFSCPEKYSRSCLFCEGTDHLKYSCPQMFCQKCGNCGHKAMDCTERFVKGRNFSPCTWCPNFHYKHDCPRKWRVYAFDGPLDSSVAMSCNLCFSDRHFSDDCREMPKKFGFSIFTSQFMRAAKFEKSEKSEKSEKFVKRERGKFLNSRNR